MGKLIFNDKLTTEEEQMLKLIVMHLTITSSKLGKFMMTAPPLTATILTSLEREALITGKVCPVSGETVWTATGRGMTFV